MTTRRWLPTVGAVSFGLHAAALIATPLRPRGKRAGLATVVVMGMAGTTAVLAVRRWGVKRVALAFSAIGAGTLAVEHLGTTTGKPFGGYDYNGVLRPTVGTVPVIVPLAWFAMAVPSRESAVAINRSWRIPLGAALLTAWDLFLDPQMVGEGYWTWSKPGRYRSIPVSNFLGWFATALAIMAVLEATLPPTEPDPLLVGEYAWMATMETLGFAAFFNDRLVAAVGGTAMVPAAVAALSRLRRG